MKEFEREVLENNKELGYIKSYRFTKFVTESFFVVTLESGSRLKLRPTIGNNQNELKLKEIDTKAVFIFKLDERPKLKQ